MALPVQLQRNEEVVKIYRRHPIYVILHLIGAAIAVILLVLLLNWLGGLVEFLTSFLNIVAIGVAVVGLAYAALEIYRYFNDQWTVTNQRIIDSTRRSPFSHQISSADLINLQDISISKEGVFATIFNFGDVSCQTAGSNQVLVFAGVAHPSEVLELLDARRDQARESLQTLRADPA